MPLSINRAGGIDRLVHSTQGRNLWAICKAFNVLPNDPLIQKLTYAQREFIINSMLLDIKEQELAARGVSPEDGAYQDDSYDDVFEGKGIYANNLVDPDIDPDDIYRQVVAKTKDKSYDEKLDKRIHEKAEEKEQEVKNIEEMQDRKIKEMGLDKLL